MRPVITLDGPGGPVEVWCALRGREGGGAQLVVGGQGPARRAAPAPPPFSDAKPEAVARAARWLLDADAASRREVLAGHEIARRIPDHHPEPQAAPDGGDVAGYRRMQATVGELVRPLLLPEPDRTELFDYQRDGVDWLLERRGALLADDMGLGKTLQAITAIRSLIWAGEARNALVVCPRTLLATWEDELERWAPELVRVRVIPRASDREEIWRVISRRAHVLITNYEQVREPAASLVDPGVNVVVADEAHRIRNLRTQVTQGLGRVAHSRFWALTGTPIERDATDLATLLSLIEPARFSPSDGRLPSAALRARARDRILRRRKADVLDQLPEVIETRELLDLTMAQRRAYRAALSGSPKAPRSADDLLRVINELRAICDADPTSGASSKVERIVEILSNVAEAREKAVVFSLLLEPLALLTKALRGAQLRMELLTGEMDSPAREAAIGRFKSDPDITALLASTRAASEGLTLVEANHVVFLNEWWNPSTNAQARDRVVRIGQQRGVSVHRFVCRGTIEESLERILERKQQLFTEVVEHLAETKGDSASLAAEGALRELLSDARKDAQLRLL